MPYRHAEDGPQSDATIEAWADELPDMLADAWRAALEVMIDDPDTLPQSEHVDIVLDAEDEEILLYKLLGELLFYKDAERLLLTLGVPEVSQDVDGFHLRATARGARIGAETVELGTDVKAVTFHQFRVAQSRSGWFCRVVLDT
jgi:SHS2 domain-containing protein